MRSTKVSELSSLVRATDTVQGRLDRATQSDIKCVDDEWVLKTGPWVDWESAMYTHIEETFGPGAIAPELGDFGPGYLIIKLIDEAASLEDYATICSTRPEFSEAWVLMCKRVGRLLAKFHSAGFVHGDLHCGNIVLSPELKPYLIDFELGSSPWGESPVELIRERSPEWDLERLDETLRDIGFGAEYLAGLEALAIAYND